MIASAKLNAVRPAPNTLAAIDGLNPDTRGTTLVKLDYVSATVQVPENYLGKS
jgi:hypothetical protein